MKFHTECTITANANMDVLLPDMTSMWKVPSHIKVYQMSGPKGEKVEEQPRDVAVRLFSGTTELLSYNEPFFQTENEIDLEPFWGMIEKSGRLKVTIINKMREPRDFRLVTTYSDSMGSVIYQERTDNFDSIMESIVSKGRCSVLNISFDKPVEALSFLTTSTCIEGNWISSFSATVNEEEEHQQFVFNFTDEEMSEYSGFLKYLKLSVKAKNPNDNIRAYVTAYGFPSQ